MAKIKYLGSADVVIIDKGENFSGRLAEPLSKRVEFTADSGHVIDTEELGLSQDAVDLLLEDKVRFKDVSGMSRIPTSLNEQIFRGLPKSEVEEGEPQAAQVTEQTEPQQQNLTKTDTGAASTGTAPAAGTRSTAGRG